MSGKILMLVESPAKAKTIQSILGSKYHVLASVGHIRDLPVKEIGVCPPDYRPQYEITKKDIVKRLKSALSGASSVVLATDDDREGEAISWHLIQTLGIKKYERVIFHELTKKGIEGALANPRSLDTNGVCAQEARRVLDRLVGYQASSPISNFVQERASAGRVQSVASRLVVERDQSIKNFIATTHYEVFARFQEWSAKWNFLPFLTNPVPEGETPYWMDRSAADVLARTVKTFEVRGVKKANKSTKPPAPFTTSTLVQKASTRLGFNTEKTMQLAQKLFEGDGKQGFITYHRTDSPNLDTETIKAIWAFLRGRGMENVIPPKPNTWKAKKGAQEAHEAIRPTDFNVLTIGPKDSDAQKLYKLIWTQAVGCQMAPAQYEVTTVNLVAREAVDGRYAEFMGVGRKLTFAGWKDILKDDVEDNEEEDDSGVIPPLSNGQVLVAEKVESVEKTTRAPAHYTEASLVRDLEARGIGRPSTYASIMRVVKTRKYVDEKGRKLLSTPLGETMHKAMKGRFSFYEIDFTKKVEELLDQIAIGQVKYINVVTLLDSQLIKEIKQLESLPGYTSTGFASKKVGTCPICGGDVVETPKAYGCNKYKEGCKFVVWKNSLSKLKKKLSEKAVIALIGGEKVRLTGLTSPRTGKKFDANGELVNDPKWGWKVNLVFDN